MELATSRTGRSPWPGSPRWRGDCTSTSIHSNSLHTWYGWAVARMLGRPHVVHAREIVVQSRAALRVERALCRHFATRVIAVSYAVAAQLDPANVVVLDEYLDHDQFTPAHAGRFRTRVGIPDDEPLIGAVARLDPLKGLDVLLDAFVQARTTRTKLRPELHLVIVGSPRPRSGRVRRRPPGARRRHTRRATPRGARRHPRRHGRSRRARTSVGGAGVVRVGAGRGAGQRHAGRRHRPRRTTRDRGPSHAGDWHWPSPRATPTRWPPRSSSSSPRDTRRNAGAPACRRSRPRRPGSPRSPLPSSLIA